MESFPDGPFAARLHPSRGGSFQPDLKMASSTYPFLSSKPYLIFRTVDRKRRRGVADNKISGGHVKRAFFPLASSLFALKRAMFILLNGRFVAEKRAVVSVLDRGFLYGDGLFETIPVCHGRPFRWTQHLERLKRGAAF